MVVDATGAEPYEDVLASAGLTTYRSGVWTQCGSPTMPHGWKLHLSSVQSHARELLGVVAPVLTTSGVPFKIAADPTILGSLNEGLLGDTQVGKFMTVYVDALPTAQQTELVERLVALTWDFTGPKVVTDVYLGGVVYCRYGEFSPQKRRNRLGLFESDSSDQELVRYRVPFEVPDGVDGADRFRIGAQPGTEVRLEALGPGYLPVGTIARNAKGNVYLALDLRSQAGVAKVVLKQGRPGCMSDGEGRDVRDRLQHHAAVEAAVRDTVHTPAVYDYFMHDDDGYLAQELVDGVDLRSFMGVGFSSRDSASRSEILSALMVSAREIRALHRQDWVHRDLSPGNILFGADGQAYLMDLELAHQLNSSDIPYSQGTVGFVSPQQVAALPPETSDDVFSFGAIIGSLLAGVPGHLIPIGRPGLGELLARLSGADPALCEQVAKCLALEPERRPTMDDIVGSLTSARAAGTSSGAGIGAVSSPDLEATDLTAVVSGGLQWLLGGARRSEGGAVWVSPMLEAAHAHGAAPIIDWRVYRSANRGVAGVLYLLAKLWRKGITRDPRVPVEINKAVDWLLVHHDTPDDQMPGLHFGEAGVAVAICEAIASGLVKTGDWTAPYLSQVFTAEPDWPDLTHGAAGQGLAALYCGRLGVEDGLTSAADKYADYLHLAQANDGGWVLPAGVESMSGKALTGFAHGAAGIVHFLARHAALRGDDRSLDAAERGAEWLLDQAKPSSSGTSLAWPLDPTTEESWNWWCHGAPGIAQAYLSLFAATGDDLHAGIARACLRSIPEIFRTVNLSQCHGLAGLGELLLQGGEILGDADLHDRGMRTAGVLADLAVPAADGFAWRVESLYFMEADLMTGGAGVLHLLARAASGESGFGMPLDLCGTVAPGLGAATMRVAR